MATSKIQIHDLETSWHSLTKYGKYRVKDGWVFFYVLNSGSESIGTGGVNIGTMPAELRPSESMDFALTAMTGTSDTFARVNGNGTVVLFANPATNYVSGSFSYPIGI